MYDDILYSGMNGNISVTIHEDGTTIREYDENNIAPFQPLSIDMKITNKCFLDCEYCHEQSHKDGKHCELEMMKKRFSGFQKGTEIALGGGNIFLHPKLLDILHYLKDELCCITNITIDSKTFIEHKNVLKGLQNKGLIYGIGISLKNYDIRYEKLRELKLIIRNKELKNIVFHLINGIHRFSDIILVQVLTKCPVLVLGYKDYGSGENYILKNSSIVRCIMEENLKNVNDFLENSQTIVSFDNRAIEQLKIKDLLTEEEWEDKYMGDEGQFSMYYDAVEDKYGVNSTSERISFSEEETIISVFKKLKL